MTKKQNKIEISDIPDSFEYGLKEPIEYHFGGQVVPCGSVTIRGPGLDLLFESYVIKQMLAQSIIRTTAISEIIQRAQPDQSQPDQLLLPEEEDKGKDKGKEKFSPSKAARSVDYTALISDLHMPTAIKEFSKLAMAGCVKVKDNNVNFLQWEKIRNDDKLEIFLQFAGVFIMPSVFPETETEDSN